MTDLFAAIDRAETRLQRRVDSGIGDLHRKVDAQSRAILHLIQHVTGKGNTMSIIDEIEADLSTLEVKAESVVSGLKSKFESEAAAVAGFKTRIAALVTTIEGLEATIAGDAATQQADQHAA